MAKCVVHLKKIGGVGLGGVRNHMDRTGVSRTNPDIDKERSGVNYSPDGFSDAAHLEKRINARIKELNLKKAVRKDAVRLVDIVITSSREGMEAMGEDGKRAFFADAAAFLAQRFVRQRTPRRGRRPYAFGIRAYYARRQTFREEPADAQLTESLTDGLLARGGEEIRFGTR